jgi:drug/metabolite transporter (DMT)-like permease
VRWGRPHTTAPVPGRNLLVECLECGHPAESADWCHTCVASLDRERTGMAAGVRSGDVDPIGSGVMMLGINTRGTTLTGAQRAPAHRAGLATWLAGFSVVVLGASAFPAIRVGAPDLGVTGLSIARLAVAAVGLLAIAPIMKVRLPRARDMPLVVACGFFGMTGYQLLLAWGELYIPAGPTSMIVAAAPLVSVGIAVCVFHERLTFLKAAGITLAILGVAVICLSRSALSATAAVWIVIAAAVAQGIYHPLSKQLLARYTGLELATYGMVAGAIMTLPFLPGAWSILAKAAPTTWLAAVYLGLLPMALGTVLWGYAVARLPVTISTSLLYLVPAVAVLIAFIWLGEVPLPNEILGGLVVIVGVATIGRGERFWASLKRFKRSFRRVEHVAAQGNTGKNPDC